jgi:hypothetical protein
MLALRMLGSPLLYALMVMLLVIGAIVWVEDIRSLNNSGRDGVVAAVTE